MLVDQRSMAGHRSIIGEVSGGNGHTDLLVLEETIEHGLNSFLQVGGALAEIRDRRLYAPSGYRSFSEYLEQRWQLSRRRAYQLIDAAATITASTQLSERLVRDLVAMPTEVRLEVVRAATAGADRRELRQMVRQATAQPAVPARPITPRPRPIQSPRRLVADDSIHIGVIDAARTPYADGIFDLIVSSPPFALDVAYADGGDVEDYDAYRQLMAAWSAELHRVSNSQHGRVCLEVPLDRSKNGEFHPVYGHWLQALEHTGFRYRTTITRRYHAGKGTARGSVDSPGAPHAFAPLMAIIVVYRGAWIRHGDGDHDLDHDDWLALTGPTATWDDIPGETDPEHPAPFHIEVPRRLIKLFSYREDLIGDLFLGRGTTALACLELGRRFCGGDRSPRYVATAQERVSAAILRESVAA